MAKDEEKTIEHVRHSNKFDTLVKRHNV